MSPTHRGWLCWESLRFASGAWRLVSNVASEGVGGVDVRHGKAPLLRWTMNLPAFVAICSFIVLYIKLGRFTGNAMVYFHHLLSPFLLLAVFAWIQRLPNERKWMALSLILLDFALLPLSAGRLPDAHADVWRDWRALLSDHRNVYAPPPLAYLLLTQHKPIYDAGLSDSFLYSMQRPLYPSAAELRGRYDAYLAGLNAQVEQRRLT